MAETRPNILWICTDSQRWDTLGCYGNSFVRTPNIDRLAEEGVLFEHAYAQNPLCTPSRGSFLTGRYPVTNRLRQNGQRCPEDLKPVTKTFNEAGYLCGNAGKLHLQPCDNRLLLGEEWWRHDPKAFFRGSEPRIDDGYHVFHWCHSARTDDPASAYSQWLADQGLDYQRLPREDCAHVVQGPPSEHHQVTWCMDKAIQFFEGYKEHPYPWLFTINCFDPHYAFDPPEDYLQPYLERLDDIPLPAFTDGELDNKPPSQQEWRKKFEDHTDYDHRMKRAAYWAMCDHIDAQVGRLLDALEASGQRDNTIIIFTSDHGEMLGDHGFYIKGPFLYDCSVRVPLIISWPGQIEGGKRSQSMVELTDLAPTLLEASGLPADPSMQGKSLWPQLTGEAPLDDIRQDVYCEYYNSNPNKPPVYATMLRNLEHKLIVHHGDEPGELYDMQADPSETHNRWDDPACASIKANLMKRLCDRMAETTDPLPERIGVF